VGEKEREREREIPSDHHIMGKRTTILHKTTHQDKTPYPEGEEEDVTTTTSPSSNHDATTNTSSSSLSSSQVSSHYHLDDRVICSVMAPTAMMNL